MEMQNSKPAVSFNLVNCFEFDIMTIWAKLLRGMRTWMEFFAY